MYSEIKKQIRDLIGASRGEPASIIPLTNKLEQLRESISELVQEEDPDRYTKGSPEFTVSLDCGTSVPLPALDVLATLRDSITMKIKALKPGQAINLTPEEMRIYGSTGWYPTSQDREGPKEPHMEQTVGPLTPEEKAFNLEFPELLSNLRGVAKDSIPPDMRGTENVLEEVVEPEEPGTPSRPWPTLCGPRAPVDIPPPVAAVDDRDEGALDEFVMQRMSLDEHARYKAWLREANGWTGSEEERAKSFTANTRVSNLAREIFANQPRCLPEFCVDRARAWFQYTGQL